MGTPEKLNDGWARDKEVPPIGLSDVKSIIEMLGTAAMDYEEAAFDDFKKALKKTMLSPEKIETLVENIKADKELSEKMTATFSMNWKERVGAYEDILKRVNQK